MKITPFCLSFENLSRVFLHALLCPGTINPSNLKDWTCSHGSVIGKGYKSSSCEGNSSLHEMNNMSSKLVMFFFSAELFGFYETFFSNHRVG